ncbi:Por secretion system C-terminal sorting domain-containing protein [Lishizhenia tianjinensis]|uniref:Por secretion system C-terminal sorting domain-containing protein n=1 Tax=Lishizhenia tianjinensis TaxID=477690 RepID=A0A1I6YBY4_9FLAO|nr:T9SS type A sorting domain-containing protein [Lishizhenia tianjinensis]SFT48026.1 Por secretion system C-terminal sorting domain-containing protein [Lishizhenia tianjinensis]
MKKLYKITLGFAALMFQFHAQAQCVNGEAEVEIVVHTVDYGYEGYWELTPAGNGCGNGTIASGGNTIVGCNGSGLQNQPNGGYGDNTQYTEGPWCLIEGNQYDLIYSDDWGDGGFMFEVFVNGYKIKTFDGVGLGATFTFTVEEPPAYDLAVTNSNIYAYVTTGNYDLHAHIFNAGTSTISSFDLNYTVNGGNVQTHSVNGLAMSNYASEEIEHNIPLSISTNGVYTLKIWVDNINGGNQDMNTSNDTLTRQTEAGPGRPNYIDDYVNQTTSIVQIAGFSEQISAPTDLDFHPVLTNKELWVINKGIESTGGSSVTLYNAGEANQTHAYKQDGNAWHFMSLPTALAFSLNGNWATAPGVYDANHNGGSAFTGPSLWSSDMSIYAQPSGGNGSHLDMLHLSPYSQGIAAETDNVFWVFDGYTNDIVRYDFVDDHGPGNDFHGDAIVRRYSDDAVAKDPNNEVVSHLVLDENQQWLYVVDHGNGRVIRIDITTGSDMGGTPNYPMNEPIAEYKEYTGYTQETVVSGLNKPAGIDVIDDRMIISEHTTGEIIIYDISTIPAVELDRIPTGTSSVQGVKIGPEGRIWFVDQNANGVYRIDSELLATSDVNPIDFKIYPNPSTDLFWVNVEDFNQQEINIYDATGKLILNQRLEGTKTQINLDVQPGMYIIEMRNQQGASTQQKLIIEN